MGPVPLEWQGLRKRRARSVRRRHSGSARTRLSDCLSVDGIRQAFRTAVEGHDKVFVNFSTIREDSHPLRQPSSSLACRVFGHIEDPQFLDEILQVAPQRGEKGGGFRFHHLARSQPEFLPFLCQAQ